MGTGNDRLCARSKHDAGIRRSVKSAIAGEPMKDYPAIVRGISANLKTLHSDIAPTMQGFSALAQAAAKPGALDKKTKELIALAIGVATRCDGCIGFHTEALVKLGASRAEVEEALGMAVYMGGGPALMYAADAIGAYNQFQQAVAPAAL
jgi:AhpD family alkylhydroperoxidase